MKKKVIVNRKFLTDLAKLIYDPKTRQFLRLCDGTLQNGPDPTDEERPMHCGLGELYFAMTGHQPHEDKVSENDVIQLAVDLSTLTPTDEEVANAAETARTAIEKLKLPDTMKDKLSEMIDDLSEEDIFGEDESPEAKFRQALDDIPGANDDACGSYCDRDAFISRSRRVAKQFRLAAELLPK